MNNTQATVSPVIQIPDASRRAQLEIKLTEYKRRVEPFEYNHPREQMQLNALGHMKVEILDALLKNPEGRIETHALSRTLAEKYRDCFDINAFTTACGVINDYCETGGKNTQGGKGFPKE